MPRTGRWNKSATIIIYTPRTHGKERETTGGTTTLVQARPTTNDGSPLMNEPTRSAVHEVMPNLCTGSFVAWLLARAQLDKIPPIIGHCPYYICAAVFLHRLMTKVEGTQPSPPRRKAADILGTLLDPAARRQIGKS